MLIGLLIATLIKAFSGASNVMGTIPEFEKIVKQVIEDKDRKTIVLETYAEYKKDAKQVNKAIDAMGKSFWAASAVYDTDTRVLRTQLDSVNNIRKEFERRNINRILEIKAQFKQNEWDTIMVRNDRGLNKLKTKQDKRASKYEEALNLFMDISIKTTSDTKSFNELRELILNHKNKQLNLLAERGKINYRDNTTLRKLISNREEYEQVMNSIDDIRERYFDNYLTTRSAFVSLVDESQWKTIIKEFNELYK